MLMVQATAKKYKLSISRKILDVLKYHHCRLIVKDLIDEN